MKSEKLQKIRGLKKSIMKCKKLLHVFTMCKKNCKTFTVDANKFFY